MLLPLVECLEDAKGLKYRGTVGETKSGDPIHSSIQLIGILCKNVFHSVSFSTRRLLHEMEIQQKLSPCWRIWNDWRSQLLQGLIFHWYYIDRLILAKFSDFFTFNIQESKWPRQSMVLQRFWRKLGGLFDPKVFGWNKFKWICVFLSCKRRGAARNWMFEGGQVWSRLSRNSVGGQGWRCL